MTIPSKDRKEWNDLLNGTLNVPLKNFFFQMKITQARTQIQKGTLSIDTAIDDLFNLCNKFNKAKNMDHDMESVFGKDFEEPKINITTNSANPIIADIKLEKEPTSPNLYDSLKIERELLFYKKSLEDKEKKIQEKNSLIIKLQEEVILLKKKNQILYDGLQEIEAVKATKDNVEEPIQEKKRWSFFNFSNK